VSAICKDIVNIMNNREKTIQAFGQGWVDRDPVAVMALIAKDNLQYFETAFGEPSTDWKAVKKLWDIVPENQKNVTFWFETLITNGDKILAHVKVTREMVPSGEEQDIDAAFIFGFDAENKINYFRQWRAVR